MHIICPNCSHENKIEYGENISCSNCKGTLAGHVYKHANKIPLASATIALCIGTFGGYQISTEDKRYPIGAEYELVDSCVNASSTFIKPAQRKKATDTCVCALDKTMNKISFEGMKKNEPEFLTHFRKEIANCP